MKVSVIIPAYNEAAVIAETIRNVRAKAGNAVREILVVDGGSSDRTRAKAEASGAEVLESPKKGRAAQMNYGAEQARGDILYFLHADSLPPDGFAQKIKTVVSGGSPAGCFRLAFDDDHLLLRFYAWFTRFDIDAFRFGDQSLFVTSPVFKRLGGFKENHIVMEDNEIVRRIKERYNFAILDDYVETSARTYQKVGVVKLQLIFVLIYTLYFFGVTQETLSHIRKNAIS